MMQPLPLVKDLVLVGGGHAHALVLRMWGMNPLPGVRVTVINPNPVAPYTGMLPGHIAGHYAREDLMIDLVRLARFAGARAILDRAVGIDRQAKQVILAGRGPVRYDICSIDVGIASDLPEVAGAEHVIAAKPLGAYAERWRDFVARRLVRPRIVVIGGGTGGVELAMASAFRLRQDGALPEITVLERGEAALPGMGAGARRALLARMQQFGIGLETGAEAVRVESKQVVLADGRAFGSDFTLSVAGAQPQGWLAATGLALKDGFIEVGPTLQTSDAEIFAAGDCVHLSHAPRPKAGVFAVREAPVLLHNLRSALSGEGFRRYRPQRDYLKLISCGGKAAVADKFGLRLEGDWLWRWKDRIDRKFMAKFAEYPAMAAAPLPDTAATGLREALGAKPLCGGCGAKVGATDLASALAGLPAPRRPEVVSGPGDDAAILRTAEGFQVMTTDHLRAFTHDARLMSRIAAVHAMGDIWAMGAAPQAALAQVTLPRMRPEMQAETLREIMEAAAEVFGAAGADVVGGHTSIGAELTLGFTVTGVARQVIAKGGARPGDALVLTKGLGTGTILAAEMAGQPVAGLLLGEVVAETLARMGRPLGPAAEFLAPQAHAMTDVTGFGLAGHLLEMLEASGCAARIDLGTVPMLPGALRLAEAGHASSLAPANRAATAGRMEFKESPASALLFDPQTAGGLLAAVPAAEAEALVARLCSLGEDAAVIGCVTSGRPWLTVDAAHAVVATGEGAG